MFDGMAKERSLYYDSASTSRWGGGLIREGGLLELLRNFSFEREFCTEKFKLRPCSMRQAEV